MTAALSIPNSLLSVVGQASQLPTTNGVGNPVNEQTKQPPDH